MRKAFWGGPEAEKQARAFDLEMKAKKIRGESLDEVAPVVLEKDGALYLDQLAQAYIDAKKAEGQSHKRLKEFASIINRVLIPEFSAGAPFAAL
jgi:hypothetical protein